MFFYPLEEGEFMNTNLFQQVRQYFSNLNGRILILADNKKSSVLGEAIVEASTQFDRADKEFKVISLNEFTKQLDRINTIADLKDKIVHDVHYNQNNIALLGTKQDEIYTQMRQFFKDLIREEIKRSDIIFILNFEEDDPVYYSDLLLDSLQFIFEYCTNKPVLYNANRVIFNKCYFD